MAFPPAHVLVGFGAAEVVRAVQPLPRWRAWAVAGAFAVLPDADFLLVLAGGRASVYHGTFTHSVFAAFVVALAVYWLAGARWALLAGVTYASHLGVDLLDDRGRTNVLLGWPFTEGRPYAIARVFPRVWVETGDGVGGAARSLLRPELLTRLLEQTAVGAVFFVLLLGAAWGVRRRRSCS